MDEHRKPAGNPEPSLEELDARLAIVEAHLEAYFGAPLPELLEAARGRRRRVRASATPKRR